MQDLLFLTHRIPYPPDKGDKIRSWNLLRHLARDRRVHLGCFIDDPRDGAYRDTLREICGDTYFGTLRPAVKRVASLTGLVGDAPLTLGYYRDRGLADWVGRVMAERDIRQAVIFSSSMAQYVLDTDRKPSRIILDMVDVDSEKWGQFAATKRWPLRWLYAREQRTLSAFERRAAAAASATVLVSEDEASLFRTVAPEYAGKIVAVENGVNLEYFDPARTYADPFDGRADATVFTGAMDYWPNIDAVTWFAGTAFRRVREARADASFWIVGSDPAPEVRRLESIPGVRVTGRVEDVRPYLAHAGAVVAPLRVAQGVQNKVLEAMAMARPVVATPKALSGIDAAAGSDVVRAPELGEAFAEGVLGVLSGPDGDTIGRRARALVARRYQWSASMSRFDELLSEEIDPPRARKLESAAGDGVQC